MNYLSVDKIAAATTLYCGCVVSCGEHGTVLMFRLELFRCAALLPRLAGLSGRRYAPNWRASTHPAGNKNFISGCPKPADQIKYE